jgi:hypothetical protein
MLEFVRSLDWLRLIRMLAQYVVLALLAELAGAGAWEAFNIILVAVFGLFTVVMIGICSWTVFLWDIDRLFFRLENRIDSQLGETATKVDDDSLLGKVRELVGNAVGDVRSKSVALIEKAYWDDINAGGVLSFPQPDIAAAIDHIDKPRRAAQRRAGEVTPPGRLLGASPIAADVQIRGARGQSAPLRAMIVRFLQQLGALFTLTALCFFISILAWSRLCHGIFLPGEVPAGSVALYQIDLMLRPVRFHGAYAALGLTRRPQPQCHRLRLLHAPLPDVRRRLRDLLDLPRRLLRVPPLARVAEALTGSKELSPLIL